MQSTLTFAHSVVGNRGELNDLGLAPAKQFVISDGEIIEITANVVLNILANHQPRRRLIIDFLPVAAAAGAALIRHRIAPRPPETLP